MGGVCCCSSCTDAAEEAAAARETEMAAQQSAKSLVVSAEMSAPTVKIMEGNVVLTGHGLALVATALEQDAAYWEWHISLPARKHVDTILFGVTNKKDQQFYRDQQGKKELEEGSCHDIFECWMITSPLTYSHSLSFLTHHDDLFSLLLSHHVTGESSEEAGTHWMRKVEVQNGDVVGVAVQQSDLPMLQFFHNGEPLYDLSVNRFRGMVYPAIFLPASAKEDLTVTAVLVENKFSHMSPAPKFGPIIVARSIV
jgi:hypothetical protein